MADDFGAARDSAYKNVGALTDTERKNAAYNVLNKTYGAAVAYDPAAALQAQEYGQRAITNPLDVEAKQLTNTGTGLDNTGKAQTNEYNALANPKRLTGLDLTNEGAVLTNQGQSLTNTKTEQDTRFAAEAQPLELQSKRANINQSNAAAEASRSATATNKFALNTAQAAAMRTATMGILGGLSDVAAEGGDIGAAFDRYAPDIAKLQGVSPGALGSLKARLVQDPVGTINTLTQAIESANEQALLNSGKKNALANSKDAEKAATQVMAMKNIAMRTASIPELIDRAEQYLPQMSSIGTLRRARAHIGGTPEYAYVKAMETLTANMSLTDLQSMKTSGLSLGRVSNMDLKLAGDAYANMDIGQSLPTIRNNMKYMDKVYRSVNENMLEDIKRVEAKARGTGSGALQRPVEAPANFQGVEGKVYTDKDGNKATFKNGKFIPQR